MRCLLDTHIWLWSILDPERLLPGIRERIEDGEDELWLSSISIWEAMLLIQRGKIEADVDAPEMINFLRREYVVRDAPVTPEIAVRSRTILLEHQDPADRFIAATAVEHGLVLLTQDAALLASPAVPTLGV